MAVAEELVRALSAHPVVVAEAAVLAAAAVLLPYAHSAMAPWGAAVFGAALLAGTLLAAPPARRPSLALTAWVTAAAVAWRSGGAIVRDLVARPTSGRTPRVDQRVRASIKYSLG